MMRPSRAECHVGRPAREAMGDRCLRANARTFADEAEVLRLIERAW
jgi:hypothetical protein